MGGELNNPVDFYFDYASPWCYLSLVRLREAAMRTGAQIIWKPVNAAGINADLGDLAQPVLDPQPRRRAYQRADLAAWADYCNLAIAFPDAEPSTCPLALRGALAAIRAGRADAYSLAVFAARHGVGEDINDAKRLREIASSLDLEDEKFSLALADSGLDAVIGDNGRELVARGGFSPGTMFVGEQMYCGHTRAPLVEFALGQASGRRFVMPGQHG